MKHKTIIINTTLGVMLVLSIICSIILFYKLSNAKQTFTSIQKQLDKDKVQVKNAQNDLDTLHASIAHAKYEKVSVPSYAVHSDPSKKLSSGLTLWEAKLLVDHNRDLLSGLPVNVINARIAEQCTQLGTTPLEIDQLPAQYTPPVATTTNNSSTTAPATSSKSNSSTSSTSGSSSSGKSSSTGSVNSSTGSGSSGAVEDNPASRNKVDVGGYIPDDDPGLSCP